MSELSLDNKVDDLLNKILKPSSESVSKLVDKKVYVYILQKLLYSKIAPDSIIDELKLFYSEERCLCRKDNCDRKCIKLVEDYTRQHKE